MKSLLAIPLILFGISTSARAQDLASAGISFDSAADNSTSPRQSRDEQPSPFLSSTGEPALFALGAPHPSLAALSFGASPTTSPVPAPADPQPAPQVMYRYNERDYRLEIAIGAAVVRFRSSVYLATGVGTHTAVGYFWKDWVAFEGAITTAFAPQIFDRESIKYLSYAGGVKFTSGRAKFEPWVHVLAGGIHLMPQTALSGKNGFEVTSGIGLDYGLTPRLSLRIEGDYLRSHIFNAWQNSGQGVAAMVVHF
jgi:hypothetical protein